MRIIRRYLHGSFTGHIYTCDTGSRIETVASSRRRKFTPLMTHAGQAPGSLPRDTVAAILRAQRNFR
jgi:hypothetical protein